MVDSYNIRIRLRVVVSHSSGLFYLRAALVTYFDDTVNYCFNLVLETMGTSVREVIYDRLARRGIPASDVSIRFDDVVQILYESFGGSARVIVYKTIVELFQQYSMHVDFTYQDSLKDHLFLLKERVINDHLVPRRTQREDSSLAGKIQGMVEVAPQTFKFK